MQTPLKNTLRIITIIAVLALCGWLAFAGTAGDFTMAFNYSALVDQQLLETRGPDWQKQVQQELRQHWQNIKNEAKEQAAQRRAFVFSVEDESVLTRAEQRALINISDSAMIREKRKAQAAADALAKEQQP